MIHSHNPAARPCQCDPRRVRDANYRTGGGGLLLYDAAFLPPDAADRYFAEVRDTTPWEQKKAAFGQLQPRLTAS